MTQDLGAKSVRTVSGTGVSLISPENFLFVQKVAKAINPRGTSARYCDGAAISPSRIGKFLVFFPDTREF